MNLEEKVVTEDTDEDTSVYMLMDHYVDLQCILMAADRDKELNYQLKILKIKLAGYGINAESLNLTETL
ncbi:MAG: hypothetical protein LUD07_06285 [Clostridiales bacterium]|nr:hypothetical protein [Clostridiales bacterium]